MAAEVGAQRVMSDRNSGRAQRVVAPPRDWVVGMLRESRQRLWAEVRSGKWVGDAAVAVGVSAHHGSRVFAESGGMMEPVAPLSSRYLSHAERDEIAVLRAQQVGVRE